MAQNLYLRQTWRYLRIFAGYGGFVTFVKSNAKALSTAVPSIKSTPVSYTHLDVYKRQEKKRTFSICPLFLKNIFAFLFCFITHYNP